MLLRCLIKSRNGSTITGTLDGHTFEVVDNAVDVPESIAAKLVATGNFEVLSDKPELLPVEAGAEAPVPVVKRGRKAKQA